MTTYTFVANASAGQDDWSSASIWSGGAVPNDPSADVVIPEITTLATGQPYYSTISTTSAYTIASLSISQNALNIGYGGLIVEGAVNISTGGLIDVASSLSVGSLANDGSVLEGSGTITCSGSFLNQSALTGYGLTVTAGSFDNTGSMGGGITLNVAPGGFANLSGSTLTGGAYSTAGSFNLNVGGVIATDAADITLYAGGDIRTWDSAQAAYQTIETTLKDIAAAGSLTLETGVADSWGSLAVDGLLKLVGGQPTFAQLTVDAGGTVSGVGSISGPVVDNGTILAGLSMAEVSSPPSGASATLKIAGPVTGSGTLEIGDALDYSMGSFSGASYSPWTLELAGAASVDVAFKSNYGILQLDDPTDFTGTIAPTGAADEIVLPNITFSSVTGYSYAGDRDGGVLTVDLSGGSSLKLKFAGDFTAASFTLAAGQKVLSSDPGILQITNTGPATPIPDLIRDHFGNAGVSDLLAENTSGRVVIGEIHGGQASFTTIAAIGPEWTFKGTGDFLGDGHSGFLAENAAGAVAVGEVSNGATTYTHVADLSSDYRILATGDFVGGSVGPPQLHPYSFLGGDRDQFLVETSAGALGLATVNGASASFTSLGTLGSQWSVLGSGAYAADGMTEILLKNTSGAVSIGTVENIGDNNPVRYTSVTAVGSEWKYLGGGDVLADGKDQFLMENTAGQLALGELGANSQARFTQLAAIGHEWSFVGAGDYLGEGHDQLMFRNTSGVLALGDHTGGQLHFTQVSAVGAEWTFHG